MLPTPSFPRRPSLNLAFASLALLAFVCGPSLAPSKAAAQSVTSAVMSKTKLKAAARSGAKGVNDLTRLIQSARGELDPKALDTLLRDLAKDRRVIAPLRDWITYQATLLQERYATIPPDEAAKAYQALGFLTDVQVLGPFADGSTRSLDTPLAPELASQPPAGGYVGKVRDGKLSWREAQGTGILPGAYIALDDMLYPNTDALAYVRTWVKIPGLKTRQAVSLQLGSGGAYRVWVNQELATKGGADRRPAPWQDEQQIELDPGWNQILIKGSVQSGLWGYYLRLTDRNGASIEGLAQRATPPPSDAQGDEAPTRKLPQTGEGGLRARLEAKAERGSHRDLSALFDFYRETDPFDQKDPQLQALAERVDKLRPSARSAYNWALVTRGEGPTGERLALALSRKNTRQDPEPTEHTHARVHAQLATRKKALGQHRAHDAHLKAARSLWPENAGVALLHYQSMADKGWQQSAFKELQAIQQRFPKSTQVQRAFAWALAEQGDYAQAFAHLQKLTKRYGKNSPASRSLVDMYLDHGDQQKALTLSREGISEQSRPMELVELARLEQASGHPQRGIELMNRALDMTPHHDGFHRERAQMLLRAGQKEGAVAGFERSLALRPQQPDLRDLLAALGSEQSKGLFERYGLGLKEVPAKIKKAKKSFPNAGAVMLERKQVVQVLSNGLRESLDQRLIYIQKERGIKAQQTQGTVYDPELSYVQVKRARVRHADGSVEELGNSDTYSLTAAGYRMFYDQRQMVVNFPGLKVGDVIDVAFLRRDIADENYFGDYFGDLLPVRQEMAQLPGQIIYQAPKSRTLYFNRNVKKQDAKDTWRYVIDTPKGAPLRSQPNMPGWTELLDYVHVSSYQAWNDVADWYWELVREQLVSDEAIKEAVSTILKALGPEATEAQKVAAIYHHVVKKTRYVGLEFGIHGYKPYRTTQIYERRFGDCKDKASLLKVMLGLAGIESNLVLVRTKDQGRLSTKPASLSAFNHAILYVPSLDLYLDGTAEFSGFGELPSADHGASVLIINDGKGGTFTQIPDETPQSNQLQETLAFDLQPDGSAKVRFAFDIKGNILASYRRAFEDPTTQRQNLQRQISSRYPGVKIESMQPVSGALDQGMKLDAKLKVPQLAREDAPSLWSWPVLGQDSQLASGRTGNTQRRHRFARRSPVTLHRTLRYTLPKGATWKKLPKPQTINSEFGAFSLAVTPEKQSVALEIDMKIETGVLSIAKFNEYRSFLQSIDQALNQRLRYALPK